MSALRTILKHFGYVPASELHAAVQSDLEVQREGERRDRHEKNTLWHDAYRRGKEEGRKSQPLNSLTPPCPWCHRLMVLISRANWICLPCAQLPELQREPPPPRPALPPIGGQSVTTRTTGEFAREATGKPYHHTQDVLPVEWPTTDKVQTWQDRIHDL